MTNEWRAADEQLTDELRDAHRELAARVAAIRERWIGYGYHEAGFARTEREVREEVAAATAGEA